LGATPRSGCDARSGCGVSSFERSSTRTVNP
jgi:hypothetical protein